MSRTLRAHSPWPACLIGAAVLSTVVADDATPYASRDEGLLPASDVDLWTSPPVDVDRLLAEDEANRDRLDIPFRIGFPMTTDLAPSNRGTWEDLRSGGRLWRLRVLTEGALWTVLGFDRFQLQPGAELRVYDPGLNRVVGPFGSDDVREHGELWFPPVAGDTLVAELYWPDELAGQEPAIHLGTVSHGYKAFGSIGRPGVGGDPDTLGVGDSGSCNIDVNCPLGDAWQNQKRGVVILLSGGSGFCSGSMINTTADDCRPYLLTAAHCGAGPSTTIGFNFERGGCNTGSIPNETDETLTGATVLANSSGSDFTLLEMDQEPPASYNVYYNGWSRETQPASESWGIHHPSGDLKKISYNADPLIDGINYGPDHWRVTQWEEGTTEGGSSGSPIFDQNQRIVGQLHGGLASCTNISWDEYGKVDASWTGGGSPSSRLSDWLDPEGTGALFVDGADAATCGFQAAGTIELDRSLYACSDTLVLSLRDDSLQGLPSQDVELESDSETSAETVTLTAVQPGSGEFGGSFPIDAVPASGGDGLLSVAHGDTITVEYVDADDGQGGTNVVVQAAAQVDCQPPVISNVAVTNVTGSTATIEWETDEPASSSVTYGTTPPGSLFASDGSLVTSHSIQLAGLEECRLHYFSVSSSDAVGNSASDDNSGSLYTFSTGVESQPAFDSTDTPLSIPDDDPAGATSTIAVASGETVLDVVVRVDISHTYDGDLTLELIPPTGGAILLADRRGGSGNDFIATVFDDDAATPISAGSPPFTGTFRPEQPLAGADGIDSTGDWRLRVVDHAGIDTGNIESWTLTLTYAAQACGPHAVYASHGLELDQCAGGAGDANGLWEAGEEVRFNLTLENDGTEDLTGVTAQIAPLGGGATMIDDGADFSDLTAGGTGTSASPHYTVQLSEGLACGGSLDFEVQIQTDQGSWTSTFEQSVGEILAGGGTVLDVDFEAGGIPAGWIVVDGFGDGETWYADDVTDPKGCGNTDPDPPIAGTWAAVDSDCPGPGVPMDEQLVTPLLDLTAADTVTLEFDHWFRQYESELADVDVRSSLTGGAWVQVAGWSGTSSANPEHVVLDLTPQAAGAGDVEIRWRYHNADYEWTWFVDNVSVDFGAPGGCEMTVCETAAQSPAPIPDGSGSTQPLLVDLAGGGLLVAWDDQCAPASTKVLYGPLDQVSTYTLSGAVCAISNPEIWDPAPAGDLWFVLVGENGSGAESSWGEGTNGERNGASGTCGSSTKDTTASCP